jgi:hypothetical protein
MRTRFLNNTACADLTDTTLFHDHDSFTVVVDNADVPTTLDEAHKQAEEVFSSSGAEDAQP